MGQILFNIFMVFVLPAMIGVIVGVAISKMRKPFVVTGGLILIAAVMWVIAVVVPNHGNEASGIMAVITTCLALGAFITGVIIRICRTA